MWWLSVEERFNIESLNCGHRLNIGSVSTVYSPIIENGQNIDLIKSLENKSLSSKTSSAHGLTTGGGGGLRQSAVSEVKGGGEGIECSE